MERHKLDLQKVREEYRIHEADCGSSQVQSKLLLSIFLLSKLLSFFLHSVM